MTHSYFNSERIDTKYIKILLFLLSTLLVLNFIGGVSTSYAAFEPTTNGGLADTPQPKYRHDINNTGQSPYLGPQTNSTVWKFKTGGRVMSAPVIGADGTIYVGSDDYSLYAINPDGTKKWSFKTGNTIKSAPIIGSDGTIYFGSYDHYFYALTPNGKLKWKYHTTNGYASPAMARDGTIYIGSFDNYMYALNPNGTLKWRFQTRDHIMSTPAIAKDNTLYFGSNDGNLYALTPQGILKWKYLTGDRVSASPVIGPDGSIYFGSRDTYFYALTSEGKLKWKYKTGEWVGSAAMDKKGNLYFKSQDRYFYALNNQGKFLWKAWVGYEIHSTPAIGSDGIIYLGGYRNNFCAFKPTGIRKWTFNTNSAVKSWIASSPAIGSNGIIYFGCDDKYLYAVGLAASAGPKGGNYQTTQKVALSMNEPGRIYYTTDGRNPTTSSNIYSTPLVISKKTVIKFMGINSKGIKTPIYTETYQIENIIPKITNISPLNNLTKYVKVTFNEEIKMGTGFIEIKNSNGTIIPHTKYINGKSLYITPSKALTDGTYKIIFHTGCVTDLTGYQLASYTGKFQVDMKPPVVTSVDPANNAWISDRTKLIKITFNKQITNGTGWIELKKDGKSVSFNKTIQGNLLTITPTTWINGNYTIILHTGCLTDHAENKLAAYTSKFTFYSY